ncbi:MAG: type II toxin-antitoxin system HicA family toxin [Gemmatimonadetes bacterium]|nr:type II toxin-antitoxin system HicA family toxin [Gemmatimonadota bacterium]
MLERAQDHPSGVKFRELCALAECFGFFPVRQKGSHHIFKREGFQKLLNFQESGSMAKAYQVRQLLSALEELGVL